MKKLITSFLLVVVATTANISFAQNNESFISVYSYTHHYSVEVKEKNNQDTSLLSQKVRSNEFDSYEVKDIFSQNFKKFADELDQINKTSTVKKEGVVISDEYGRKIFLAVIALKRGHLLLEGGEKINGIYYPNIVSMNGMEFKEDPDGSGMMNAVLRMIKFK